MADQIVSATSNMVLFFAVANRSSTDEVGVFAIAQLVYSVGLGLFRAAGGQVIMLRSGDRSVDHERDGHRLVATTVAFAFALAAVTTLVALVVGLFVENLRLTMLAFSVLIPILLLHDALRYVLLASGRVRWAVVIDTVWLVVIGGGVVVLFNTDVSSPIPFVFVWGLGALAGIAVALARFPQLVGWANPRAWFSAEPSRTASFGSEFAITSLTQHVATALVAVVSGLHVAAILRAGNTLVTPPLTISGGLRSFTLGRLQTASTIPGRVDRLATGFSAIYALLVTGWVLGFMLLPDTVGEKLLGETWALTKPYLLAFLAIDAFRAASFGFIDAIRVSKKPSSVVTGRIIDSVLGLLGSVGGAIVADLQGNLAGRIVAAALSLVAFIFLSRLVSSAPEVAQKSADMVRRIRHPWRSRA